MRDDDLVFWRPTPHIPDGSPANSGNYEVVLNCPDKLNALTEPMGENFEQCIKELSELPELKTVILTGQGRAFSAGGDLAFLHDRTRDAPAANVARMRAFYRRFLCVRNLPVPVIAAINGPAIGAGLCLAMACDLRLVADTAKLGATFVGLGLHPGMGGTFTFPRVVGFERASHLLLTGKVVTGTEAVAMGLALEAHPANELLSKARDLAASIAAQSPVAVRQTVATLRHQMAHMGEGIDAALQREAESQAVNYASADLKEGIAALREKRRAEFPGI